MRTFQSNQDGSSLSRPFPISSQPLQSIAQTKSQCFLQNDQLPPVSDVAHFNDQCFCHLCTCGQHICPGDVKRTQLSQPKYRSKYQGDFQRPVLLPPKREKRPQHFSMSPKRSDLISTNQQDYVAHRVTPPKPIPKPPNQHLKLKFAGKSIYQMNYANWNTNYTGKAKGPPEPNRREELKMALVSSYSNAYSGKPVQLNQLDLKKLNQLKRRNWVDSGTVTPFYSRIGENTSTSRSDYTMGMERRPSNIILRSNELVVPESRWGNQYRSTYGSNYLGNSVRVLAKKKYARPLLIK